MAPLQIKKATKKNRKLRLALVGVSKSGKTYTALKFARALAGPDGKIGVIETEGGNSEIYEGDPEIGEFYTVPLDDCSPQNYIKAMKMLIDFGCVVLVQDSLSHAWAGRGGCLEIVDTAGGSNKFSSGWSKATPLHNDLIAAINSCPVHLIATMRQKAEYVLETNDKGRQVPRRVGMAAVQREGMEYEFDVTGTMQDATLTIDGIRGTLLEPYLSKQIKKPGAEFIAEIRGMLDDSPPEPAPQEKKPETKQTPPKAPPTESAYNRAKKAIAGCKSLATLKAIQEQILKYSVAGELIRDEEAELDDMCVDKEIAIKTAMDAQPAPI